jgi:hypothetical protein
MMLSVTVVMVTVAMRVAMAVIVPVIVVPVIMAAVMAMVMAMVGAPMLMIVLVLGILPVFGGHRVRCKKRDGIIFPLDGFTVSGQHPSPKIQKYLGKTIAYDFITLQGQKDNCRMANQSAK